MTSYASPQSTHAATTSNATLYWKISAPVLAVVAVLGFVANMGGFGKLIPSFLEFDVAHNLVHLLIAVAGLYLGFAADGGLAKAAAKLFGVVYLGLAAIGFLSATVFGIGSLLGLHLELGENLIHLALGAWAAYVGFSQ